jgi:hypothetical protein
VRRKIFLYTAPNPQYIQIQIQINSRICCCNKRRNKKICYFVCGCCFLNSRPTNSKSNRAFRNSSLSGLDGEYRSGLLDIIKSIKSPITLAFWKCSFNVQLTVCCNRVPFDMQQLPRPICLTGSTLPICMVHALCAFF